MTLQRLPDFLVIGAARCGTTTLHQWLLEHPEVHVSYPKRPEPHFFLKSDEYAKGLDYYSTRYFQSAGDARVAGEVSSSYLLHPQAAERIREHLPNVRLIAILRHPVERAWSSYWFTRGQGFESLSFEEAVRREPERTAHPASRFEAEVQPHAYIGRSRYMRQIDAYRRLFPGSQLLVCLYDDLVAAPETLARRIFGFLGVDDSFVPPSLHAALNATAHDKPPMTSAIRRFLLDGFREDNRRLAEFLQRDLSAWDE